MFLDEDWAVIDDYVDVPDATAVHFLGTLPDAGGAVDLVLSVLQDDASFDEQPFTATAVSSVIDSSSRTYVADFLLLPPDVPDPGGYPDYVRVNVPYLDSGVEAAWPASKHHAKATGAAVGATDAFSPVAVTFNGLMPDDDEDNLKVLISNCPEAVFDGHPCRQTQALSPFQMKNANGNVRGRVLEVQMSLENPLVNPEDYEILVRFDDPDDPAVYEGEVVDNTWIEDTEADDNLCDQPYRGHFHQATEEPWLADFEPGSFVEQQDKTYLRIPLDANTEAPFRFEVSECPGDNYDFRAAVRRVGTDRVLREERLSASGVITGFERLFIEVDRAAEKGLFLRSDVAQGQADNILDVWTFLGYENFDQLYDDFFDCNAAGDRAFTCCRVEDVDGCSASPDTPYRALYLIDADHPYDPDHHENSEIAFIRGVTCDVTRNKAQYADHVFENNCRLELVTSPTGTVHFVPQNSYDAFEFTGSPDDPIGAGLGAAALLGDASGAVNVLTLLSWNGGSHESQYMRRMKQLGQSAFWDVVLLEGDDVTPLYPKTSNLVFDQELDFSNVFFKEFSALPRYSHVTHQSLSTRPHVVDVDKCKPEPCDSPFDDWYLLFGISPSCGANSRTSVLFADNIVRTSGFPWGNELASTGLHEALHLFDLNTPFFKDTNLTMSCDGPRPPVCTSTEGDPPAPMWCGDHSAEGPAVEPIPAGLPYALQEPCLMWRPLNDTDSIIRHDTALSTADPSDGATGRPAESFRLRDHVGLRGGMK